MSYRSLKSVFHQFDKTHAEAEEQTRRSFPSALHWDYKIGDHPMFAVVTAEIAVLLERVMLKEREALGLWQRLPGAAQVHYLNSMVIEEIQASNDIEHVHSSRQEIADAIRSLTADGRVKSKRFQEMVRLYLAMSQQGLSKPTDLDGIRGLYDGALADEIRTEDAPDGERFRAGPVHVTSGIKSVHEGVLPESAIDAGLSTMLDQSNDDSIPNLIRAVAGHFIFEHVHPFYDGNGRMGRLLLALDLSQVLSPVAWLSLSATISNRKEQYYRAFVESEHPLNRGEVTTFVETMLGIVAESLGSLRQDLAERSEQLDRLGEQMERLSDDDATLGAGLDDGLRGVLFILGQASLFGPEGSLTLDDLSSSMERSKQFVRPLTLELERLGLVQAVSKRPLRFTLTSEGKALSGLA